MPAGQEDKPAFTQLQFFRDTVKNHDKVAVCQEIDDQIHALHRTGDLGEIVVYLTNLYTVGYADVLEITSKCRNVNCIVTMSGWNGYTSDAKRYATENHIGLFKFDEFMGALNFKQIWKYVKRDHPAGQRSRYK
jgi:hypothetical protein